MKKWLRVSLIYLLVLAFVSVFTLWGSQAVTVLSEHRPIGREVCVIIDAGHGGVDGGAISCSGILESQINLEISLRLEDLLHLLGIRTQMIRTDDRSVYTEGNSIAAKKVSDLKERVRIVNNTENAILISIHQNTFPDSRYSGAQVFYGKGQGSQELAKSMQSNFVSALNPGSNRKCKKGSSIYLLENVNCTAILVECGFLSHPAEEARLRDQVYQQQICSVIATTLSTFLSNT